MLCTRRKCFVRVLSLSLSLSLCWSQHILLVLLVTSVLGKPELNGYGEDQLLIQVTTLLHWSIPESLESIEAVG